MYSILEINSVQSSLSFQTEKLPKVADIIGYLVVKKVKECNEVKSWTHRTA